MNARRLAKGMLIGLGAGVTAAWFAHPDLGKKRRAAVGRNAKKILERAAREGRKSLWDSQHRLAGLAAKLRTSFIHEQPSDRVLEERIRSRIGRVASHPRKIRVACDHGVAILWGLVPEEEVCRLIEAVTAVQGVTEVVDHLEIAKISDLPAGRVDALRDARDEVRLNWSPSRRLLVGAAGAALALRGWQRRDALGGALAFLGAGMIVRSAMPNHLRATLAFSTSGPGFELEKTIRVHAPISDLFDFWIDPENYPKVFSHVAGVERLGENLYRWTIIGPAGIPIGWEGVITRTVPNTLVEWKSLPGSAIKNFGIVHFDPHYDASTRIHIHMFYRPPAGILGRFFAQVFHTNAERVLDEDLRRMKYLFENGGFISEQKQAQAETAMLKMATT